MAEAGHMEAMLEQDLLCPGCGYNLRGLSRVEARCPECGQVWDVVKLLAVRWTEPWYKAPGFGRIITPMIVGMVSVVIATLLGIVLGRGNANDPWILVTILWGAVIFAWGHSLVYVHQFMGWRGVRLALFAHVVLAVELLGIGAVVGGTLGSIAVVVGSPMSLPIPLGVVVLGLIVVWGGRRGERYIAENCIRHYLGEAVEGASEDESASTGAREAGHG